MPGSDRARWIALVLCMTLGTVGCASSSTSGGDANGDSTGSLSLELAVADGFNIDEVLWRITGGDMPEMSGIINTSAPDSTASVEVFGIPEGSNFLIEMEATSTDGELTCEGSADFDVTAGEVTEVHVMLNCKKPTRLGGVRVDGTFNICSELTKVVVSPLQTSVGNNIDLLAKAVDHEDDAIAFLWTSLKGSIADPTAAETTYTCTEVGDDEITITVSDDMFAYCMSMWTVRVTCVQGDGDLCEGVTCENDDNECTTNECDPLDGWCKESNVADGTSCDSGEGMCMGGVCEAASMCSNVVCEDLGECVNNLCNPDDGSCQASTVENGTPCDGGNGACTGGTCVDIDRCMNVVCQPPGECQVSACNSGTGMCDASDAENGTSCDAGAGTCMDGECVPADQCAGVVCDDLGECVNNFCNPNSGSCESSNVDDGTVCDGGGSMCTNGVCEPADLCMGVVCTEVGECQTNTCNSEDGMCQTANVDNGVPCLGGQGICMNGDCMARPSSLVVAYTGPPAAFTNQEIELTIEVMNTDPTTATGVVLSIDLPDMGTFVSSDPNATPVGDQLILNLGNIPGTSSATATITWVTPNLESILNSTATATSDTTADASDDVEVQVGLQTIVTGGATAAGTGLRNRTTGAITITEIPPGAVVTRAVLVWALLYEQAVPSNQITFEGQVITADLTQTISSDLCWAEDNTIGYATDVTDLVPGNGVYTITDPVNSTIRLDIFPQSTFPLTDGASLVVFYGGPGLDAQVLSDFSYSAEADPNTGVNLRTLEGIESVGGPARLYLAGPDGQLNFSESGTITGFGSIDISNSWDGSDPIDGPSFFLGNLWDTDVYDVTSLLPPGRTTLDVSLGLGTDCTGISAVVLEVAQ